MHISPELLVLCCDDETDALFMVICFPGTTLAPLCRFLVDVAVGPLLASSNEINVSFSWVKEACLSSQVRSESGNFFST